MDSRTIIFHYHLFKNAGTSLDASLQAAFPGRWVTKEFSHAEHEARREMHEWIESEKDAICFSSHTAVLPAPAVLGLQVLPVIFLRQPIDRIASAYAFEATQTDENFGSALARNTSLAGYVETRLALNGDPQCRNFHVWSLSRMFPHSEGSALQRAMKVLSALPFIGIVEEYETSLQRLERTIAAHGLGEVGLHSMRLNASRDHGKPMKERIADIRERLGERLFSKLLEANRDDLELYEAAISSNPARGSFNAEGMHAPAP